MVQLLLSPISHKMDLYLYFGLYIFLFKYFVDIQYYIKQQITDRNVCSNIICTYIKYVIIAIDLCTIWQCTSNFINISILWCSPEGLIL